MFGVLPQEMASCSYRPAKWIYGTVVFLCWLTVRGEEECVPGKYGIGCSKNCSQNCNPLPNNRVLCHKETGKCFEGCNMGVHGDQCDQDCSTNCLGHICNQHNGHCTRGCIENHIGVVCEIYTGTITVHQDTTYSSRTTVTKGVAETGQPGVNITAAVTVPVVIIVLILVGVAIVFIWHVRKKKKEKTDKGSADAEGVREPLHTTNSVDIAGTLPETKLTRFNGGNPRMPFGDGDRDERYVEIQEYHKMIKDLFEQISTLTKQLQEREEKERSQMPVTSTDATGVGDDLPESEGNLGHEGDASESQHASGTVTDLRRQLAETRQELNVAMERMHRLEITHQKAWSESDARRPGPTQESDVHAASGEGDTGKSGTPTRSREGDTGKSGTPTRSREGDTGKSGTPTRSREGDTATPTAARRDDKADLDLHVACISGKLAEVKRILDTGRADVNCRGGGGFTPVMWAAWTGHGHLVKLLVRHGAHLTLVDGYGHNILHWACAGGDRETVEFVLSLDGVDVNAKNNWGNTAADVTRDRGDRQLLDLLESRGAVK